MEDKDFLVLGDFNIPALEGPLYAAVTSGGKGLAVPESLLRLPGTDLAKGKRYDQILHHRRYTSAFTDRGGAVDSTPATGSACSPGRSSRGCGSTTTTRTSSPTTCRCGCG